MNGSTKTPRQLGYRMPAEWEPHEATWLAWPHNPEDWPGKFAAIPWLYAEIVRLLAARERVHLIVEDASDRTARAEHAGARRRESRSGELSSLAHRPRMDARLRADLCAQREGPGRASPTGASMPGPSTTTGSLDDQLPGRVAKLLGLPAWQPSVEIEDGAKHAARARRRIDRRQRRGHSAHHRRMPAERSAAAQSRREPRATGAGVSRLSRHRSGHLAGSRHCRRRHAWPRRRHRALCRAGDDCCRRRARYQRPQSRAAGRKSCAIEGRAHGSTASSSRLWNCPCRAR